MADKGAVLAERKKESIMSQTITQKTDRDVLSRKRIFPAQGPLAGFRVLDLSQVLAAPYLGTMLSDMGAEVIKIEPSYGDSGRGWPPFKEGAQEGRESGYYAAQNRGKFGLAMDLTNPKAKNICMELAKLSDILIENWRPGVMTRRGLGYEQIRQINPRVAYDVIAQAESGYQWMNGFPDRAPHALDVPWSDMHTGTNTAVAVIAALIQKIRTGRGQWIDIALSDCMVASNENLICMVSMADDDVPAPCRSGLRRLSMTPYGVFKAKDDYLVIGVDNDKRFGRLCEAMGRSELACDPIYDTNHHRLQNRRDIETIVENWCAERTVDDCVRIFRDEHAVPAGHILARSGRCWCQLNSRGPAFLRSAASSANYREHREKCRGRPLSWASTTGLS
jgi:CoA:oxalate CoA-transferase